VGLFNLNYMKDRYILMRNSNTIDGNFVFDYAVSKGFRHGVNEFNMGSMYLNVAKLLDDLDKEYDLTVLYDQQGKFIKVIT
jgi:hypothetical protein